jgi:hypothetical protein
VGIDAARSWVTDDRRIAELERFIDFWFYQKLPN